MCVCVCVCVPSRRMKICGDHPTTANLTTCQHEENGYTMADMPQNKLHPRNIKLFNGKSRIQPWFSW